MYLSVSIHLTSSFYLKLSFTRKPTISRSKMNIIWLWHSGTIIPLKFPMTFCNLSPMILFITSFFIFLRWLTLTITCLWILFSSLFSYHSLSSFSFLGSTLSFLCLFNVTLFKILLILPGTLMDLMITGKSPNLCHLLNSVSHLTV